MEKVSSFTDLDAWRESHKLVLLVYRVTATFPDEEKFGLTSQMRRAAISVTSNIAEGFGRNSAKDKRLFYTRSKASIAEIQNQGFAAHDLAFMKKSDFEKLAKQSVTADKLIAGLLKSASDNT